MYVASVELKSQGGGHFCCYVHLGAHMYVRNMYVCIYGCNVRTTEVIPAKRQRIRSYGAEGIGLMGREGREVGEVASLDLPRGVRRGPRFFVKGSRRQA